MSNQGESFLQSLKDAPSDLRKCLRVTKKGIFIPEDKLQSVYESYQTWLQANNISLKSEDKLVQRIFGSDEPNLVYLPEGSVCFVGFISPLSATAENISFLPSSVSVLIDSLTYIHPKDPWISSAEGIRIKTSPQSGSYYQFTKSIGNESVSYKVKESDLRSFIEYIRSSAKFVAEYPLIKRSMRDAVEAFYKIIFNSKAIGGKKFILIPEEYKGVSGVTYRISSNLVFIVNAENQVVNVYETRGKNYFKFLEDQFQYLTLKKNVRHIDVIELTQNHKFLLGRVKIKGKFVTIEKKAFFILVDSVGRSHWFRGKLEPRYTIKDILVQIAGTLKYADWVDLTKLTEDKKVQAGHSRFELKYTPWTFKTGKSGNIYEFVEGGRKG